MTLAQLQSFVLVARHGSVKAAAAELEVTEPAVSVAVAALRKELGDDLFVRNGRGIALTPGGRRLAALATEILGLAEQARLGAELLQQLQRLVDARSALITERCGDLQLGFLLLPE
jgi:DNA-binding transcriptional LysR family regulator